MKQCDWQAERSERIWRCECGGPHFVCISRHVYRDEELSILMIEDPYRCPGSFWQRLRAGWRLFRHGYDYWSEIHLDADTAFEIADELQRLGKVQRVWELEHESLTT